MNLINKYLSLYGVLGTLRLAFEAILTKFKFRKAKLIRLPFECRGKKYIRIDRGFTTGRYCRLESYSNSRVALKIGENCQINDSVHIVALNDVLIGNNVLIASRVFITDLNHGLYSGEEQSHPNIISSERKLSSSFVHIADNVWLGEGVAVLPGTSIGENTIVGANSVVSKSLDSNSIYVGNPARLVKKFNFDTNKWERV